MKNRFRVLGDEEFDAINRARRQAVGIVTLPVEYLDDLLAIAECVENAPWELLDISTPGKIEYLFGESR